MRVIRCDCGFEEMEDGDVDLVSRARDHARAVHGMELPPELVVALTRPTASDNRAAEGGADPE